MARGRQALKLHSLIRDGCSAGREAVESSQIFFWGDLLVISSKWKDVWQFGERNKRSGVKSVGQRKLLAVWKKGKYLGISDVANGKVTG